jgi:hypothetical protein
MREQAHKPRGQRPPLPDPPRRKISSERPTEPREVDRPASSVKDTNVVRGDDRPQSVRHAR